MYMIKSNRFNWLEECWWIHHSQKALGIIQALLDVPMQFRLHKTLMWLLLFVHCGTQAWQPKCTWLPLNSGKSYSYTLVSKYHKIWKAGPSFTIGYILWQVLDFWPLSLFIHFQDTKGVVSTQDILKKESISGVIALKESMKFFDANFFNDSKVSWSSIYNLFDE